MNSYGIRLYLYFLFFDHLIIIIKKKKNHSHLCSRKFIFYRIVNKSNKKGYSLYNQKRNKIRFFFFFFFEKQIS